MKLCLALSVMLLIVSTQSSLLAQPLECTGKAAQANLSTIDPVYVDAVELARYLIDRGFIVKCVQASKMQMVFDGQKGAALYVTDQGSFDVLFLPKAQSFSAVEVVEESEGKFYSYSFRGTPRSPMRMKGKKTYFIKSDNLLFVAWADGKLARTIQDAFPISFLFGDSQ